MRQPTAAPAEASACAGSSAGPGAGPEVRQLDSAELARLEQVARDAALLYPGDTELQRVAINAATEYLLGSLDPVSVGADLARFRIEQRRVRARARQIAVMAFADGRSERSIARDVGVDRMNVRRWLGKPRGEHHSRDGGEGDR